MAAAAPWRHVRAMHVQRRLSTVLDSTPERPLRMLLIGPPGSGKGTQSAKLQRDYGLSAIASGDLLRWHMRNNTEIGKAAAKDVATGGTIFLCSTLPLTGIGLVKDEIIVNLVTHELDRLNGGSWLLDGFPRTPAQASLLDEHLSHLPMPSNLNLVVHLSVPDSVILSRIRARWIHPGSGRVYNLDYNPPKIPFTDDVTGEPLVRRVDDDEDVFAKRLVVYRKEVGELLRYYEKEGRTSDLKVATFEGITSDAIYRDLQFFLDSEFQAAPALTHTQGFDYSRLDGATFARENVKVPEAV